MAAGDKRYAGFPSVVMYKPCPEGKSKKKKEYEAVHELLWGDEITLKEGVQGDWQEIYSRDSVGWVRKNQLLENRLLEMIFVDVGQGDGCLIVTPAGHNIIVDAGQEDNMYRYLGYRFKHFEEQQNDFESMIITHPDQDHYGGFEELFKDPKVSLGTVYHNGIIDRGGSDNLKKLGKVGGTGDNKYLLELAKDKAAIEALPDKGNYIKILKIALASGRVGDIRMISKDDEYLPGYGKNDPLKIKVLGPVPIKDTAGHTCLPWFLDSGKTKNGHSVVLRILYKSVSILIGGDLNAKAEDYLLNKYTGLTSPPAAADTERLIASGRKIFESEVCKSCHHGSADFTDYFLQAVNPIATVISSGDNEPHSHPRANTLGAIGKFSRGSQPLIFSTELARSPEENIKHPYEFRKKIKELQEKIDVATDEKKKAKLQKEFENQLKNIKRSIATYGAINLRTDGNDIVFAQKIESGSKSKSWDIYVLKRQADGSLAYEEKLG